jgi:hypothetical protein
VSIAKTTHDLAKPKFVAELPKPSTYQPRPMTVLDQLRKRPGQWAEVSYYPLDRDGAASARGNGIAHRHPDIEYATRKTADKIVLFLRAKPVES